MKCRLDPLAPISRHSPLGHTPNGPGERVIAALAANPRPENAFVYDEIASGATYVESDPIGLAGESWSTYSYVGDNPLWYADPLGLTQCDINIAYAIARQLNPDLYFGEGPPVADLPLNGGRAGYNSLRNQGTFRDIPGRDGLIHLDMKYLDQLDTATAVDLLDTIIHELLHGTRPPELQVPRSFDYPYIVPEAAKRVAIDKKKVGGSLTARRAAGGRGHEAGGGEARSACSPSVVVRQ